MKRRPVANLMCDGGRIILLLARVFLPFKVASVRLPRKGTTSDALNTLICCYTTTLFEGDVVAERAEGKDRFDWLIFLSEEGTVLILPKDAKDSSLKGIGRWF
jgi:hypothetical protein